MENGNFVLEMSWKIIFPQCGNRVIVNCISCLQLDYGMLPELDLIHSTNRLSTK